MQQLLVWLPEDHRLYWLLGEIYNAQGKVGTAREILKDLVENRQQRFRELVEHRQKLSQFAGGDPDSNPVISIEEPASEAAKSPASEPVVQWRSVAVGFGAGLIFALFAYWQIKEIQRRLKRTKH